MRPCLRRCRASSGAARGCQACTRWPTASCPCLLVDLPSTGLILRDVDEAVDHVVDGLRVRESCLENPPRAAEKVLEAMPDRWLKATDFIHEAIREKLHREGKRYSGP